MKLVYMIKSVQGLSDSALLVIPVKLKTSLTFLHTACNKYSILINEFYTKIEHIIPSFKQLSSLQIIDELMASSNHYINLENSLIIVCYSSYIFYSERIWYLFFLSRWSLQKLVIYNVLLLFWWIITAQLLTLLKNVPKCFSFLCLLFASVFSHSRRNVEQFKRQQLAKMNDRVPFF